MAGVAGEGDVPPAAALPVDARAVAVGDRGGPGREGHGCGHGGGRDGLRSGGGEGRFHQGKR